MSKFNWRSSDEFYKRVEGAEIAGFAWECLRRNPGYQQAQRTAPSADTSASIGFRRQWGLVFRS
ncbi:transcriptional regulator domain-containing protein [Bradyrhizobium sp. STM 3557]|uniref:transcriptional regulator domain-containing protein n=1 Tax=Bradyrhizobium sp. STM 3557 TaxID=578920 RepID=UPI003890DEBF